METKVAPPLTEALEATRDTARSVSNLARFLDDNKSIIYGSLGSLFLSLMLLLWMLRRAATAKARYARHMNGGNDPPRKRTTTKKK
jgi:hypothetical protein